MLNRKPEKVNPKTVKRIFGLMRKYRIYLVIFCIFAIASTFLNLVVPILTGKAIDCLVGMGEVNFTELRRILIRFVLAVTLAGISRYISGIANNRLSYSVVNDLRNAVFSHIQELPISYLDGLSTGDTMSRLITDVDQFADGLIAGTSRLIRAALSLIGTMIVMFSKNVSVAVTVLILSPISLVSAGLFAKFTYRFFRAYSLSRGNMSAQCEDVLNANTEVRIYNYEETARDAYAKLNEDVRKVGTKAVFLSSLANPTTRFINSLIYAFVGVVGGYAVVVKHSLSVGDLSALLTYCNRFTKPFNEISGVVTEIQNSVSCIERVFELLDAPAKEPDSPDAVLLNNPSGAVEFKDVTFSYVPDKKLISHLSFSVMPGQRVAIVGPTGCGKTTLINLLMRFYEPQGGCIRVDGIPLRNISTSSLRSCFGMVLQDTWLMTGTIADNIAYGCPNATHKDIVEAAKKVHAHGFIRRLPNGYSTVISEDGGGLSEGQRQLICVARVMLMNPSILALDEATSSIDTLTEHQVQEAFATIMKGRTTFVVAHRLSTILHSDLILVMRDGDVIEKGTHEELMALNGFYRKLYDSQYGQ